MATTELLTWNLLSYKPRSYCKNTGKRNEVTKNSILLVSDAASVVLGVSNKCRAFHLQSSGKDPLTREDKGMTFPKNAGEHSLSDVASNTRRRETSTALLWKPQISQQRNSLRCEVLRAVSGQIVTFWAVAPCHHVHSYHLTIWRPKSDDNLKSCYL
jgi:hypothetical protein